MQCVEPVVIFKNPRSTYSRRVLNTGNYVSYVLLPLSNHLPLNNRHFKPQRACVFCFVN